MNNNVNGVQPMNQPQTSNNDFISNIPKDRNSIIGYVGALVVIIANFLAFATATASAYGISASSSVKLWGTGLGKLLLVCAIGSVVLIALKKHAWATLPTGFATLIFLYDLATIKKNFSGTYTYSYIKVKLSYGPGMFLTLLGLAAIGVSIFLYWKENPNCFSEIISKLKGGNNNQQPQPMGQPMQQQVQPQPMMQQQVQPQPMMQPQMQQPMGQPMPQQPVQPEQNNFNNNNMM